MLCRAGTADAAPAPGGFGKRLVSYECRFWAKPWEATFLILPGDRADSTTAAAFRDSPSSRRSVTRTLSPVHPRSSRRVSPAPSARLFRRRRSPPGCQPLARVAVSARTKSSVASLSRDVSGDPLEKASDGAAAPSSGIAAYSTHNQLRCPPFGLLVRTPGSGLFCDLVAVATARLDRRGAPLVRTTPNLLRLR